MTGIPLDRPTIQPPGCPNLDGGGGDTDSGSARQLGARVELLLEFRPREGRIRPTKYERIARTRARIPLRIWS